MKESTLFSTLEKSCGSPPHATLQPSPIICNGPPDHSLLWPLHMCSLPRETHTPISIEWGRERNCSTERKDKAQLQSGWVSGGRNEQQYQCVVKTYKVKKKLDSCLHFPPIVPVGSCYRDRSMESIHLVWEYGHTNTKQHHCSPAAVKREYKKGKKQSISLAELLSNRLF